MIAGGWFDHQVHGQADDLDATERIDGRLVRYRIHHDTSYWDQSSAKAEVWSPGDLSWHLLASVLPGVWAGAGDGGAISMMAPQRIAAARRNEVGLTVGTEAAYAELQARARAVLGITR